MSGMHTSNSSWGDYCKTTATIVNPANALNLRHSVTEPSELSTFQLLLLLQMHYLLDMNHCLQGMPVTKKAMEMYATGCKTMFFSHNMGVIWNIL